VVQERGGSDGSQQGGSSIQRPRRDVADREGRPSRCCSTVPAATMVVGCSLGVDGAAMMEGEEENMRRSTPCAGKKGPGTGWSFLKAL
jgi:hypothetical protein